MQARRELSQLPADRSIPTFLPRLQSITGGWKPGELIAVASRAGEGRTTFAVASTVAALRAQKSVLYLNLELSQQELEDRLISSMGSVPLSELQGGGSRVASSAAISAAVELNSSKLTIDSSPRQTLESIRSAVRAQMEASQGLDLIVIDYLELIDGFSGSQIVGVLFRELKALASELSVAILVLTQVSRSEHPKPLLDLSHDSLATVSDRVLFLRRMEPTAQNLNVVLMKNRTGKAHVWLKCEVDFSTASFREIGIADLDESSAVVWELGEHGGS